MSKKIKLLGLLAGLALFTTSCEEGLIVMPTSDGGILIKADRGTPPRINSFDFYPKNTTKKEDIITFTVSAVKKGSEALQYTWKASKGTLLTNSGNTVSWKPERADGSMETGVATITVTVSDGKYTVDASANVFIYSDGRVSNNDNIPDIFPTPRPTYTPLPSYTPVPTPSPIYYDWDHTSPYYKPTPTPSSYNYKKLLFEEDFQKGYLDDTWSVTYSGYGRNNYLTWKKFDDDTRSNNKVALLTGPTDDILTDTCEQEVKLTSTAIDLRYARLPRLEFEAKSAANPSKAVKLNIYWSMEGKKARSFNISFIPDKNWNKINVDLKNLISEQGGGVGLLTIGAVVCNNKNEFRGPMIDNIKIYDDASN